MLPVPLSAQQMKQSYRQFEIDTGAALYASNCGECHGDGTGVPGVNMRTGQFPSASSDEDLLAVIRNGVPGTAMPPHDLPPTDLLALVAYLRSLQQDHSAPVKLGDPEKGKALFDNQGGCLNCHRVGDEGSRIALNLSDAGTLHPASFLERALLDPNSLVPEMPESRFVRAVTKKGTVILGRRLNEDTYTLQLIDQHENLVSLDKDDLRSMTILKTSPMPSVEGKFTSDQVSDLVAYLVSLQSSSAPAASNVFGIGPGVGGAFAGRGPGSSSGAAKTAVPAAATGGATNGTLGGAGPQKPRPNP